LALKIADWSSWDDTYAFIQDHNPAYLESNVQDSSLQSLAINYILFYNAKQQLVASKGTDIQTGAEAPLPPELLSALAPGSSLLARTDTDHPQGLLATATHPLLLAIRPILRTDNSCPARGTIVLPQYLDDDRVDNAANRTQL